MALTPPPHTHTHPYQFGKAAGPTPYVYLPKTSPEPWRDLWERMINPATAWLRCLEQRPFTSWETGFEFKRLQEAEMVPLKGFPSLTHSEAAKLPMTTCRELPGHPWAGGKYLSGSKPECRQQGRTPAIMRFRLSWVSLWKFFDPLRRKLRACLVMGWSGQKGKGRR